MKNVMCLTCWHYEVLWLSFRQTLQNDIESIDIISSKANLLDSTAATRLLIGIAGALGAPVLAEEGTVRRRGELGGDGRSKLITGQPHGGQLLSFLYIVCWSPLLTVSGLYVPGLFP